jgi:hypothetical protein
MGNNSSLTQTVETSRPNRDLKKTFKVENLNVAIERDSEKKVIALRSSYNMDDVNGWSAFRDCLAEQARNVMLSSSGRTIVDATKCQMVHVINSLYIVNFIKNKICLQLANASRSHAKKMLQMALVRMDLVVHSDSCDVETIVIGSGITEFNVWKFLICVITPEDQKLLNVLWAYDATSQTKTTIRKQGLGAYLQLTMISNEAFFSPRSVLVVMREFNNSQSLQDPQTPVGSWLMNQNITPIDPPNTKRADRANEMKNKYSTLQKNFELLLDKQKQQNNDSIVTGDWIRLYKQQGYNTLKKFLLEPEAMRAMFTDCARSVSWQGIFNGSTRLSTISRRFHTKLRGDHPMASLVETLIKQISPNGLRLGQQVVIKSTEGCKKQLWHTDYSVKQVQAIQEDRKPASVLVALSRYGADLWLYVAGEKIKLHICQGDALVFRGDTIHAGAEYDAETLVVNSDKVNVRYHAYLESNDPKIPFQPDRAYPVKSMMANTPDNMGRSEDEIQISQAALSELLLQDERSFPDLLDEANFAVFP